MGRNIIETCLSPGLFDTYFKKESIAVVIDTLRATSSICAAFANGAEKLIPVGSVEEAREMKNKGFLVAAERDGFVLDFADFGNSPFNFTADRVRNNTIVYSTTNGTRSIEMASGCHMVLIGSFLNLSALVGWLSKSGRNLILLCAGWKNRVNIEDSFFAGALASGLIDSGSYETDCDATKIALDMWKEGSVDPLSYIEKAAQRSRLRDKGLDDCIAFCHTADSTDIIPAYSNGVIININKVNEQKF